MWNICMTFLTCTPWDRPLTHSLTFGLWLRCMCCVLCCICFRHVQWTLVPMYALSKGFHVIVFNRYSVAIYLFFYPISLWYLFLFHLFIYRFIIFLLPFYLQTLFISLSLSLFFPSSLREFLFFQKAWEFYIRYVFIHSSFFLLLFLKWNNFKWS